MNDSLNPVFFLPSLLRHSKATCKGIQDYQNTRVRRLVAHAYKGQANGEVTGGVTIDSLLGVNAVGFINREVDPGERVRIK